MRVGKVGFGLCDLVSVLSVCHALCGSFSVSIVLQVCSHDCFL